ASGRHPGKMNSQKRESRVEHRVNESLHRMPGFRFQFKIFSPERHNLDVRPNTSRPCHMIAVQSRAVYQVATSKSIRAVTYRQVPAPVGDMAHLLSAEHLVATVLDQPPQLPANARVIDNAGAGNMNGFN